MEISNARDTAPGGRDAQPWEQPLGATPLADGLTAFRVWAPRARDIAVEVDGRDYPLGDEGRGTFAGTVPARPGDDYRFVIDAQTRVADPCSRFQPQGVLGASRVVDPAGFVWSDQGWRGVEPRDLVIYELHIGTFSPEGTFAGVAAALGGLRDLGVTAIELMPVATFPGDRNWGYDGLYTWAPHHVYGGPAGLVALVDAAHAHGMGVLLDVVYNHLGPGAESLEAFGPYLTDDHHTPWGAAVNFDGRHSGGVREWAIQNACMWIRDYHLDGLRLDAVHAIVDLGAHHVLSEMTERVRAERPAVLIAESDLNDPTTVTPSTDRGQGFDAQWADDFHHSLHAVLTGESDGYYADFGSVENLAEATTRPFIYDGRYSRHRRRRHGAPADGLPRHAFVVCGQNHDQIGNRALGDRLPQRVRPLAAMWVLLSPYTPMLFMGEEYGEQRPFLFFTDHIDPHIAAATRAGRRQEFAAFTGSTGAEIPDPQDLETFRRSVLNPGDGDPGLRALYQSSIALRRTLPEVEPRVSFDATARWIALDRAGCVVVGNFGDRTVEVTVGGRDILLATDPGVELRGGCVSLPAWSGGVIV